MKTKTKKRARACTIEGCGSSAREGRGLCDRHERMKNAPPCSLEHCDRPAYARDLCEAHYRRKMRDSEKWDGPIIHCPRGDLVMIATRVPPEVREAFDRSLERGETIYSKLSEFVDKYLEAKGLTPEKAHAA